MTDEEEYAYTARAQAIAEVLADYEASHPPGAPCFEAALRAATEAMQP